MTIFFGDIVGFNDLTNDCTAIEVTAFVVLVMTCHILVDRIHEPFLLQSGQPSQQIRGKFILVYILIPSTNYFPSGLQCAHYEGRVHDCVWNAREKRFTSHH